MEKFGFVYLWHDRKYNRYYIGCHWGTFDDDYICSSSWMRDSYYRRPQDFKRRILSIINTNRLDLFKEEDRWLNMIKTEELGNRYYNKKNPKHNAGHWSTDPETYKQVIERVSTSRKGQPSGWKGKTASNETREKQRQAKLGTKQSEEQKQKRSESLIQAHQDKQWGLTGEEGKVTRFQKGSSPWNKGIINSGKNISGKRVHLTNGIINKFVMLEKEVEYQEQGFYRGRI